MFMLHAFIPVVAMVLRELLTTLRRRRHYATMGLSLLVLLCGMLLYFLDNWNIDMRDGRAMSELSEVFFLLYGFTLYLVATLLAPTIASNTICSEKQQEELDLVRMSYITPVTYLLGKAANILGLFFLFVVATLPFAATLFYFTGIDWSQFGQVLFLVALTACTGVAAGLLCSTWCYRTVPAAVCTYLLVLAFQVGIGILMILVSVIFYYFDWASPEDWHFAVIWAMIPARSIANLTMGGSSALSVWVAIAYNGALIAMCTILAYRLLNRPTAPIKVNQEKTIDDPAQLEQRRKKFPYYLIDPRRRRPLIGDRQNPILAKERCTSFANRKSVSIRILYTLAIVSVVTGSLSAAFVGRPEDGIDVILYYFAIVTPLLLCLAPTYVATAFSKEHEWGNWDMLRMTLLSPTEVVWGKFCAALLGLALPTSALLLGALPFLETIWRYPEAVDGFFLAMPALGTSIVYALALCTCLTVRTKRSLPALVITYVSGFMALFGIPFILILCGQAFRPGYEVVEMVHWLSPFATLFLNSLVGLPVRPDQALTQAGIFLLLSGILMITAMLQCGRLWHEGSSHRGHQSDPVIALGNGS